MSHSPTLEKNMTEDIIMSETGDEKKCNPQASKLKQKYVGKLNWAKVLGQTTLDECPWANKIV